MIVRGDCLQVMGAMAPCSVDAIVSDPPYGLLFMGKSWDHGVPGVPFWEAALAVAKPGAHLLAFGGTRTFHRLAVAIEDAGWEVRDCMSWLYGSGFPKSLDVSKAIDKAGGGSPALQARTLRAARCRAGMSRGAVAAAIGCTEASVRDWEEGRSRAAGRPVEYITPSEQYRAALANLLGYSNDERVVCGAGGGSRPVYETGHRGIAYGAPTTPAAREWQGWGTALKPAWEPVIVARKPLVGTVAANVLEWGTGAVNVDGCRLTGGPRPLREPTPGGHTVSAYGNGLQGSRAAGETATGRWPANVALDEAAAAMLDEQVGDRPGAASNGSKTDRGLAGSGTFRIHERPQVPGRADSGGPSRFFFCAKASTAERTAGGQVVNRHPTVKPVDLMRWLVRLVTPPGGLVLDPFAGSGSTAVACVQEGFRHIGIERDQDSAETARARELAAERGEVREADPNHEAQARLFA